MKEQPNKTSITDKILEQLNNGQKKDQIESMLIADGHEAYFVKDIVAQTVTMRHAKQRSTGLTLILIGAVISLLSCVLTIASVFPDSAFPYVLYGLTSIGIIIVFAGLAKVF